MDESPEPQTPDPAIDQRAINQSDTVITSLTKAIHELEQRNQLRSAQELKLRLARAHTKRQEWDNALHILRPLWQNMTFRNEGWWDVAEEIGWELQTVAAHAGDGGTVLSVTWELMNNIFQTKPNWHYDIMKALEGLNTVTYKPAVVIHQQDVLSFLSATLAFEQAEGKVGEPCTAQLTVTSNASASSAPITMSEIKIAFEGSLRPVTLHHETVNTSKVSGSPAMLFSKIPLSEATTPQVPQESRLPLGSSRTMPLLGKEDLTLTPGGTRVFEFSCPLREPGGARAISATFSLATDLFDLDFVANFTRTPNPEIWWYQRGGRKRILRADSHSLTILPKPPKMDMRLIALKDQYYTNEPVKLLLEVSNGEEEETIARLAVQIVGDNTLIPEVKFTEPQTIEACGIPADAVLSGLEVGRMASADKRSITIEVPAALLPAVYEMTMDLSYNLATDIDTRISRTTSIRILVVSPFEANYDFSPRLHLDPWPSFFSHNDSEELSDASQQIISESNAQGLAQKWCLTTRYASFAVETLIVDNVDVEIQAMNGGISCTVTKADAGSHAAVSIQTSGIEESQFSVVTQKLSLDDRRSASLDLYFVIMWRRKEADAVQNTTKLPVPRLLVSSSEPRVLASVCYSSIISSMLSLDYTIENPSMHFLTFGVVMSPNEKFAFSGAKQSTIQLVPLSRCTIRLQILPLVRGEWIRPQFVVKDRYFQKVLKVAPTDGMRVDKDGILVWVPPEDDL